jgi:hypothetical protein
VLELVVMVTTNEVTVQLSLELTITWVELETYILVGNTTNVKLVKGFLA